MDLDVVDNVLHLHTYFHVDCFKKTKRLFLGLFLIYVPPGNIGLS